MQPVVTLDAVTVGYPVRVVLESVDAALPAGRTTAIVGPNGSGKSTLLDAIAGVRPVLSGSVTRSCRTRPAYVTQRSALPDSLPLTVRAAVAMGRWAHRGPWLRLTTRDREVVTDCLRRLELTALGDRSVASLSGGQRQRMLLAQGLAQQSELLLLDEPETGLDVGATELIEQALDEERRAGTSVVRITHDRAVALRSDHCLVLGRGLLVAADVPATALRAGAPPATDASGPPS
ncbi:zinc ABC transporter ATP-binding protein AztA [Pseudonocardia nematodicida]|uniref:Zinc ABC transporter ATP-binding protein AztA n=1 Tax=Pseudonocardia nematodicida TaxID=1206997 RepID=A0ABV1KHQ7_9PSEU